MVDVLSESGDFEVLRKRKIGKLTVGVDLSDLRKINAASAQQELNQPIFNVDNFKLNIENLANMAGQGNDFKMLPEDVRKVIVRNEKNSDITDLIRFTRSASLLVIPAATKDLNRLLKAAADKGNVAALDVFIESAKEKENSAIGKVAQHYKKTMDPKKISEFKANNDKSIAEAKKREEEIKESRAKTVKKILALPRLAQKAIPGSRGTIIRNALATVGLARRKPHKEGGKGR